MEEFKTPNIPTVSVNDCIDTLAELYSNVLKAGMPLKSIPTPFLWGAVGVGKSQGIRQLADRLAAACGRRTVVTDVRLLLFNPIDLRGIPVANNEKTLAVWLKPSILKMDESEDCLNILFLDELSAAPQTVQAAAYQICLDRTVGEHALPDNCIVIAAGNRTTDRSVSFKMPRALCNRLMHFNIKSDFDAWRSWAVNHGIDGRIIGFLGFDHARYATDAGEDSSCGRLCQSPDSGDLAFATPRSWEFVSNILKAMDCDVEKAHLLISAAVGGDVAVDFENWCKVSENLPSIDNILAGTETKYPRKHDVLYTLVASISSAVISRADKITVAELQNACDYANRFPKDFVEAFYEDLNSSQEIRLKLMKCRLPLGFFGNKRV